MTKQLARRVASYLRTLGFGAIVVGCDVHSDACDDTVAYAVASCRLGGF